MYSYRAKRVFRNTTLTLAACLLLTSCSSIQFAYNRLDWYLLNRADHYLDLNSQQQDFLEIEVEKLHQWHRHTQLPAYANLLDESAQRSLKPLTDADFIWAENQMISVYVELMERAIPPIASLLGSLDNEQIRYFEKELAEELEDRYEYLEYSTQKKLEFRIEKTIDQFESGYDELNELQKNLITRQITNTPDISAVTHLHQQKVNRELIELLATDSSTSKIEKHLRAIWLYPESTYTASYQLSLDTAKTNYYRLMKNIHSLATQPQIDYLQETLTSYRVDLTELTFIANKNNLSCEARRQRKTFKGHRKTHNC